MVAMPNVRTQNASTLFDSQEITRALSIFAPHEQVVELRVLEGCTDTQGRYKRTYSGYFDNPQAVLQALRSIKSAMGFYITLQPCEPDLLHRAKNKLIESQKGSTTSDREIIGYNFLLIDIDSDRKIKGISSTVAEHEAALAHIQVIGKELCRRGWPMPLIADSGNGGHAIYRINLSNEQENIDLVKRVLEGLGSTFNIANLHVDTTVYNPARICKLYGTRACKGDNTNERPHRMARILEAPDTLEIVSLDLLNAIASHRVLETPRPLQTPYNASKTHEGFTADDFIARHNLQVGEREDYQGGYKWMLDACPFCGNTDNCAILTQAPSGALGFNCSHNSCEPKKWQDFRTIYEPDAYTRNDSWQRRPYNAPTPITETITPLRIVPLQHTSDGDNGHVVLDLAPVQLTQNGFNLTDLGNAERFAARYNNRVRWCETWNSWYVFNDRYWEKDIYGKVDQLAKATVRAIYKEASAEEDDAKRKQIVKHAMSSESSRAVRAMLDRAKSELPSTTSEYNTHIYLLNCKNGTLDLRTGELRPHNPHDLLTYCIKVNYNPLATCVKWEAFMGSIQQNNEGMITFLQQALGMSLCGDVSEQCLFMCHGLGSNGKTTMLEVVRTIMDDYGCAANIETFQMKQHEGINNDVAELYGTRFVNASETKVGSRLNEALVKKVTGKEPLRARRLHENEFQFMPEFTLWLSVNHKPVIKDDSKGMWRRVRFVPFLVTFEEKDLNPHLTEDLLEESEGILTWLVRGCLAWTRKGRLTIPDEVKAATEEYRVEMDVVTNFFADECIATNSDAKVGTKQLLERFEHWCDEKSEKYDAKQLKKVLHDRGFKSERSTGGRYVWHGIGLLDHTDFATDFATDFEKVKVSEGSEGSELKNEVNTRSKNTSQKIGNFSSLPSLPSLPSEISQGGISAIDAPVEPCEQDILIENTGSQRTFTSEGTFTTIQAYRVQLFKKVRQWVAGQPLENLFIRPGLQKNGISHPSKVDYIQQLIDALSSRDKEMIAAAVEEMEGRISV